MTVSTTVNRVQYNGNGASSFNFPYYLQNLNDLGVAIQNMTTFAITPLVLNTDYTLNGTYTNGFGYENGVTLSTLTSTNVPTGNIPSGTNIVLFRQSTPTQQNSFPENGPFSSEAVEASLDENCLAGQRTLDLASRCAALQDGDTQTFNPALPAGIGNVENAGCILTTDPTTSSFFVLGPTVAQISSDAAASAEAAASAAASEAAATASEAAASASASSASSSQTAAASSASSATASQTAAAASAAAAAAAAAALYNATVGTGGTYATLAAAIAAASPGWKIAVLSSYTVNTAIAVNVANLQIDFLPAVTYTQGSASICLDIEAAGTRINGGRFSGFTTCFQIESGNQFNFIQGCRFASCTTQLSDLNSSPNNLFFNNITES